MISVEQWRAVIGCFVHRRRSVHGTIETMNFAKFKRLFRHRRVAVLFVVGAMLMLCGDVESNPGPPRKVQTKLNSMSSPGMSSSFNSATTPEITDVMVAIDNLSHKFDRKFEEFQTKVNDIVTSLGELKDGNTLLKTKVEELTIENQRLWSESGDIAAKLERTEKKLEDLENRSRRNNLIFHGLTPDKENETWDDCERLVKKLISGKLGLGCDNISFERVHRIGSSIIAKFTMFKDKERVMRHRNKLKGSNIFVSEDFSLGVRETRKRLLPFLNWFRSQSKRASLVFDHLVVDGVRLDHDVTSGTVFSKRDKLQYKLPQEFASVPRQNQPRKARNGTNQE